MTQDLTDLLAHVEAATGADRESPMSDHRAHIITSQSLAGDATQMCRFEDDGSIFIRIDGVRRALRNAASWVAEEIAEFCGVFPDRDLVRRLDLGEATAPDQLEAAIKLRLMNAPGPGFSGIRITLESKTDGTVSMHTQGFNVLGTETERLLKAALESFRAEVDDFRRCPFHQREKAGKKA